MSAAVYERYLGLPFHHFDASASLLNYFLFWSSGHRSSFDSNGRALRFDDMISATGKSDRRLRESCAFPGNVIRERIPFTGRASNPCFKKGHRNWKRRRVPSSFSKRARTKGALITNLGRHETSCGAPQTREERRIGRCCSPGKEVARSCGPILRKR